MDYEQLYKEALERAKYALTTDMDKSGHWAVNYIFPTLKESDDERIRKDIVSFLRSKNGYMNPNEDWDFHNRWLPWLEKQGEQKPAENSGKPSENVIEKEDMTEYNKGFECGKQRVLKYPEDFGLCKNSAWSEEDERILEQIKFAVLNLPSYREDTRQECIDWLKLLKERFYEKKGYR